MRVGNACEVYDAGRVGGACEASATHSACISSRRPEGAAEVSELLWVAAKRTFTSPVPWPLVLFRN